jgi:hypothetical protein
MKKLSLFVLIATALVLAIGTQASAKSADLVPSDSSSIDFGDLHPGYGTDVLIPDPELGTDIPPEIQFPGFELFIDADGDGVNDSHDNCPGVYNPELVFINPFTWETTSFQPDADDDGVGDACDNCIEVDNPDQEDTFGDPDLGDACEPELGEPPVDTDGDGSPDSLDNCPEDPNPDQADEDEDGVGDVCDVCLGDPDPLHQDLNDCVVDDEEKLTDSDDESDMTYYELPDEDIAGDADSDFGSGGGCSMVPTTALNPLIFLLISAAFIPVATRRKE